MNNSVSLVAAAFRQLLFPLVTGIVVALLLCGSAGADDKLDTTPSGDPVKEKLPNGGYKEVYKNAKGERIIEDEFDGSGIPTGAKYVEGYHPNGQESRVWRERYAVDDTGNFYVREIEETVYDKRGNPVDRVVYQYDTFGREKKVKETTWPPGSGKDGKTIEWKWKDGVDPRTGEKGYWQSDALKKYWEDAKKRVKEWNKKFKKKKEDSSYTPTPGDRITYFRGGEVEINTFAIWAIGNAQETHTHERTVKDTRTVTRDRKVERTTWEDIPGHPGFTPVTREVVAPVPVKESFRRTVRESEQVGPFDDHAFGLGVDAKYFVTSNVGAGVEMNWLSGDHNALTFAATGTVRFPCESYHLAPYLVGGLGVQCADTNRLVGFLGAGLMKRFSHSCGAFIEGRYRFDGDEENVCEIRTGISIVFGHGAEETGPTLEVERTSRRTTSDTWDSIDPIAKTYRR